MRVCEHVCARVHACVCTYVCVPWIGVLYKNQILHPSFSVSGYNIPACGVCMEEFYFNYNFAHKSVLSKYIDRWKSVKKYENNDFNLKPLETLHMPKFVA